MVAAKRGKRGFTIIELLIAMVIIGILAAIAIPNYSEYIRRGQVQEAFSGLAQFRVRMEQYYQDNRQYYSAVNVAAGNCGVSLPPAQDSQYFSFYCGSAPATGLVAPGALAANDQRFFATAVGRTGSVAGFIFTISESGTRQTTGMVASWGALPADAGLRWIDRKP
jgi:type IV pilus assembly protein PilE